MRKTAGVKKKKRRYMEEGRIVSGRERERERETAREGVEKRREIRGAQTKQKNVYTMYLPRLEKNCGELEASEVGGNSSFGFLAALDLYKVYKDCISKRRLSIHCTDTHVHKQTKSVYTHTHTLTLQLCVCLSVCVS